MRRRTILTAACVAVMMTAHAAQAQADFKRWPAGSSPREVGKRVAERFAVMPYTNFFGRTTPPRSIIYPETCAWYGALTFARLSKDKELTGKLWSASAFLR